MDIAGKLVVVTGGSAGIGRSVAVNAARLGAEAVIVADLDDPGACDTLLLVEEAGAVGHFFRLDVTDMPALAQLFADVEHRFGPPDIVHNNAGIVTGTPSWPETSLSRIDAVIHTNLTAVIAGTRLAMEHMRGRGGVIVNTASIAAFEMLPNDPTYAATKAGVAHFTRSCAASAAAMDIRINAVAPGLTDTGLIAKTGDGSSPAAWMEPALEALELLRPSEVARAVIDLINDDSCNGEVRVLSNRTRTVTP